MIAKERTTALLYYFIIDILIYIKNGKVITFEKITNHINNINNLKF